MSASLVGSEMCIRDRWKTIALHAPGGGTRNGAYMHCVAFLLWGLVMRVSGYARQRAPAA
eukprot:11695996-Alexandrium_andersonii.AAC.1